jgi:cytochrome c biogenesis protein CcmG/thiol:disulfide interchange protein DsbE
LIVRHWRQPEPGPVGRRIVDMRKVALLMILAASLVLLRHRSAVQAWARGMRAHPLVGRPAPELPPSTHTLDGAAVSLGALRGRPVLIHFWTFG